MFAGPGEKADLGLLIADCGLRIVEQEETEETEGRLTINSAISASSCKKPSARVIPSALTPNSEC